ncbi:MAG TPA: hypothetical protein VGL53_21545 [Bryobacteraceae bacterium]
MESELQILISAVDEASETIAEVGESVANMADEVSTSTNAAAESFAEFGLQVNATTGEIEDAMTSTETSMAAAAALAEENGDEIMQVMMDTGVSAQEAAATIAEANAAIEASSDAATTSSAGAYAGLAAVAGIAFLAIKGGIGDAVDSAQQWDEASAQITQILKDTGSAIPLSQIQAYAQQLQSITLFSQQDVLSSEALILSHTQLQGSYQETSLMAADLATKMGSDLPNATRMLTNALADPVAGLNQLIRQGNIDFPAATVTIIENMAKVGDTAGADALILQTLSHSIGGVATAAAGAPGAAITQLGNQMTALGTVIGNDLLPLLDQIAKDLEPVISAIATWAQEHPKLTDAIVLGSVALAALLLLVGLVGVAIITITPVIELLSVVFGALAVAAALPALPFIALGVALVALAVLIIANWTQLKEDMEAIGQIIAANWDATWSSIYSFGQGIFNELKNLFTTSLNDLSGIWNTAWSDMSGFLGSIWTTIQNTVKTGIDYIISAINGFINALDALHISIPSISIPGTKLATPAINLGFSIPDIPMLADGGFVTQPTLAIIGEAGPEAVIPLSAMGAAGAGTGSMQQIIVNINGGVFPADASTIRQIGNMLANSIVQNIRVKNYAL